MLLKLIRWLRGYIIFSLSGKYPERFINLLNRSGVLYWEFYPDKGGYKGKMNLYNYKKIRTLAKKASVKLRCEKRSGLPFYINRYRKRKGLFIGAALAVIIMYVLSGFVWDVKLCNVENLSVSDLKAALYDSGLSVGVYKNSLDLETVERNVIFKVPKVRWIQINALNCIAEVEIKEEIEKPKSEKNEKYPCNLIADSDGVITKIIVGAGFCEVKKGSAVMKNQLLVNSVVKGENEAEDKLSFVHGKGKIFADVKYEKEFIIPKRNNIIIPNSNYNEKTNVNLLWFTFPAGFSCSVDKIQSEIFYESGFEVNNVTLPIGFSSNRVYGFKPEIKNLGKAEAKVLLKNKALLYEKFNFGKYMVKKAENSFLELKDSYKLKVDYVVNKNIAKKHRIKILKKVE